MINKLANQCKLVLEVVRLPVAKLCFDLSLIHI